MADTEAVIPNRAFFKASEVCEIAQVQAYVLRTWELEFPSLGVPRPGGGPRIYRRQDVERVLQIKQLMFTDGLTLAGARRRLEGDVAPPPEDDVSIETLVAPEVREKLAAVKRGLRSILAMLGPGAANNATTFQSATTAQPPPVEGELFPSGDAGETGPGPKAAAARPRKAAPRTGKATRQPKAGRR